MGKKKRKASEKGIAAEEKAKKKELKKLKKLKKLQAELGGGEVIQSAMEEAGASESKDSLFKKTEIKETTQRPEGKGNLLSSGREEDRPDVVAKDEKEMNKEEIEPSTPPTPGLEEDECDILSEG